MRWEGQRVDAALEQPALPGMPGLLRTVRTPEFAGLVFHEVVAKSVLNRIPPATALPFNWTVNPYRGCSHACVYCLAPDTPILMANGRTKALADVRVGDEVYGTVRDGNYRRYVRSTVLAHWATVKPAYRLTLEDGTRLIASGDHRFLSDRGWKFVTGRMQGTGRRPHLTAGHKLVGTGQFAPPPKESVEYQRGYLRGVIRGDGHPGSDRLALADHEGLDRANRYLASAGVAADRFHFQDATKSGVQESARLVAWPAQPDADWYKGFLAGIFDAEGSHSGIIRISSTDLEIVARTVEALRYFGFDHVVENRRPPNGLVSVRLRGGLAERLRFLHTVNPAITPKRCIEGTAIKSDARLGVDSIEPLGLDLPMFDITTTTGDFIANGVVSHNCFARKTHTYLDMDAGADFNTQLVVKVNAAEVLARELRSPRWSREPVAMGTNTDPYQRAEGRYRLMPGIIGALVDNHTPFSVLTKGTLLARDLPLLAEAATRVDVGLGVSIAMLDRTLSASVEPGTPSPQARLRLVRQITDAGLRCSVMVAPVLPGLTDEMAALDALLGEIAAAGAAGATVLALHLRPGAREWYRAWLDRQHPDLVPRYDQIYGRGSYADRTYQTWLANRVRPLLRKHGLHRAWHRGDAATEPRSTPAPVSATEQLTLL